MLEEITEFFNELNGMHLGLALGFWAVCLLLIWKMFDPTIMRLHIRIITSIMMLPICYVLVTMLSSKD